MSTADLEDRRRVHLCLLEPFGYLHSGALLDPLVFFQHELERCGAVVTAAKNELADDALNLVFGAHLGVAAADLAARRCVLVNLEQLGTGGAQLPDAYLRLLRAFPVIDYHPANTASYATAGSAPSIVRLGYAEYLDLPAASLDQRDIELLFIGSMTPRRLRILRALEAAGQPVSITNGPVYGPERDALVRRAKAVLNISAYEANRFEQVRASVVLSCGTPLISEQRTWTSPSDQRFAPFVHWFDPTRPEDFFQGIFASPQYASRSSEMLRMWREEDVDADFRRLLADIPVNVA